MAQQQIITKPYVEELQDNDSLFINHDGALRQIKKSGADFASGADMRAEVAAREVFEAQEVAAREAFEKSETEAREQFETSVGEQIAEKANVDGYYEEMTVGDAEQLVATQFVEDNKPYLFRPTGGSSDVGNRAYLDKIVGGTVAWNQLFNNYGSKRGVYNVLLTPHGNSIDAVGTVRGSISFLALTTNFTFKRDGRKYLVRTNKDIGSWGINGYILHTTTGFIFSQNEGTDWNYGSLGISVTDGAEVSLNNISFEIFDLTQMFGSTIADYIYSIEQSQAGAGVAWFKKLFPKDYYPYNAGELLSVEGLKSHDTVGFNQWDEEWEVGYLGYTSSNEGQPIPSQNNTIRSKNFIKVLPNTSYYFKYPVAESHYVWRYDENKNALGHYQLLASGNNNPFTTPSDCHYIKFACEPTYGTTYNHDICINLNSPSRNGEYEPYEKHSYPLDSSLTLRGIPKLDASNNLYYDGDEYTSDGKVKRKYGVVDLGTLEWNGFSGLFYAMPANFALPSSYTARKEGFIFSNKYSADTQISVDASMMADKKALRIAGYIYIKDTTYTDVATFKSAMSGVMLVYELATPTTETAESFHHTQIVDDLGTEEFVSTGIVPVGHKTRYPANLRDKLQHLPDLASMDGTYLIRQLGKQMSLIHMPAVFPDTPTEDGTYTLKTVVTGGVATLQWVVE